MESEQEKEALLGGAAGEAGGQAAQNAGESLGGLADRVYDAFGKLAEQGRAEGDTLAERLGGDSLKHTLDHAVNVVEHEADGLRDSAKAETEGWAQQAGDSIRK